jgi:hypothetical protein
MQTMALVFWCSLFQCAAPIPGFSFIFVMLGEHTIKLSTICCPIKLSTDVTCIALSVVLGLGLYGKSMWEAAFERSLDRLDEHTGNGKETHIFLRHSILQIFSFCQDRLGTNIAKKTQTYLRFP